MMKKVTAALLVHRGRLLIAQRPHTDKLAGLWEFPGGKIESGETPELCLRREMQEEFNIEVQVGEFFGDSIYHYQQGTIQLLAYWAVWKSGQLETRAHDDYRWVLPMELKDFLFAPADVPFVQELCTFNKFTEGEIDCAD